MLRRTGRRVPRKDSGRGQNRMKTIVLYESKYGAARTYAKILSQKTGADLAELSGTKPGTLGAYDAVLLCGGVYAGKIAGLKFFRKHASLLREKRAAVFAVGLSPADEATLAALKRANMTDRLADVPLFYGRGAWKHGSLSAGDRFLCRLLHGMLRNKAPETYEEAWMPAFMNCYGKDCDLTDENYLNPVIGWVNGQ